MSDLDRKETPNEKTFFLQYPDEDRQKLELMYLMFRERALYDFVKAFTLALIECDKANDLDGMQDVIDTIATATVAQHIFTTNSAKEDKLNIEDIFDMSILDRDKGASFI